MATETSRLIVELMDKVSEPAKRVASGLTGITRATRDQNGLGLSFSGRLDAAMERNERSLSRARGGMVDAAAGFFALKAAIGGPVAAASAFEDAMADVTKVVDFESPEALAEFERRLQNLSSEIPIAVNGLANIAAAAGQSGIAGEELIKFTDAAARVGVAFDMSAGEAGESMAKLRTALGLSTDEVILLADSFNHLSNNQASTAAEITDFMKRTAATAETYGFAAKESAAFGSAMIASGAEANVAATSFRNMGRNLTKGESATKRVRSGLADLGLEATDVAKRMQDDAVGTTLDVLERIRQLPEEMQAASISNIFGDEARALGPIIGNLDLIRDSLDLVRDDSEFAGSAFDEAARRMDTFGGASQTFKNQITQIGIALGNALIPRIQETMEALRPVLTAIRDWIAVNPGLASSIFTAMTAVIGLRVALAAFRFLGLLGKGGVLSLISGGMSAIGATAGPLARAASESIRYQEALAKMAGTKVSGLGKIAAGLKGIAGVTGLAAAKTAIAGVVGVLAGISAPVWLAIAAAVAAIGVAWKYWDRITAIVSGVASAIGDQLRPVFDWLGEKLGFLEPLLQPFAGTWRDIGDAVSYAWGKVKDFFSGDLFKQEDLTGEEFAKIEARAKEAATAIINWLKQPFVDFFAWIGGIGDRIKEAIGSIDLGSIIEWPEPPAWWQKLFGDEPEAPAPVAGGAAARVAAIRAEGPLPTDDRIAELIEERERLEATLRRLQSKPLTPGRGGDKDRRELKETKAEIERVSGEIETAEQRSEELREALAELAEQSVEPEIRTTSIDDAMRTVDRLEAALGRINSASPAPERPTEGLSGARARGGPITRGGRYLVGERGPELITAQSDGYVHPSGQAPAAGGATVHFAPQFTFHNTRAEDAEQIASQMRDVMRSEVREAFRGVFADTSMRFV